MKAQPPKPAQRRIKIPIMELYRVMKALILERVFAWEREQDKASGDWKWRGRDLVTDEQTDWLIGWDALPPLLSDLQLMYHALTKMVVLNKTQANKLFSSLVYDPANPQPHVCTLYGIPTGKAEIQPIGAGASDTLIVAIGMAILNYYNLPPMASHQLYFPARYLELPPDEVANKGPGPASRGSGLILPGRPSSRRD